MKKGLTELVFILDRSGSMNGLESDTIGGFNTMLNKQKEQGGECYITTVLFDDKYELLHDRIDIKAVGDITEKEYYARGSTALLDAIGRTISKIGNAQKHTADEYRAEHVMVVIITDGYENSSREYSSDKVKAMIERQQSKYNWEFVFLGANIDAVETAQHFGIDKSRAGNFHADSDGVNSNFAFINEMASDLRVSGTISEKWVEGINANYKRKKKS